MARRRKWSDAERRARLVARHHLGATAADVTAAVRGVVALHSSDPITPHLAAWARVADFATDNLDHALVRARSLWRLHAMRRTLFVVPREDGAIFEAAVGRKIAKRERARLEGWVAPVIRARAVGRWLAKLEARVLAVLADGERRTQELSEAIPELATQLEVGSGKWVSQTPLSSRLLFVMAMDGRIVRTRPAGSWRSSQYGWAATARWFGGEPATMTPAQAEVELARRYLAQHGPVTSTDLRWWSGWTAKQAAVALSALEATAVELEGGGEGWVLPNDVASDAPERGKGGQVALLPGLDPTPMGYKERDWFLGEHAKALFDTNGNVGPTVWLDGRVVGGWAQRPDGTVVVRLLEAVGKRASDRVAQRAEQLSEWMGGVVATPRFRTPLERELSAPTPTRARRTKK